VYDADVYGRAFASAVTYGQFQKQALQHVSAPVCATDTCATVSDELVRKQ
jgi:hypothetical protein